MSADVFLPDGAARSPAARCRSDQRTAHVRSASWHCVPLLKHPACGGAPGLRLGLLQQVVPRRQAFEARRCLHLLPRVGSNTFRRAPRMRLPADIPDATPQALALIVALHCGCGLGRGRGHAGDAIRCECLIDQVALPGQVASASLPCCDGLPGLGIALGLMAATLQRKQFPRRAAASSPDKFFALPGSPRCCDRRAMRPAHPWLVRPQQGRNGATLFNPKGK
ncbi:hypothetical protein SAMN05428989_2957 [Pseudoxanthomonas sp. GM95]|nr:hypothetical protein SAMN05428989_2957 [Pseudoxanthomonas sp. GM95]